MTIKNKILTVMETKHGDYVVKNGRKIEMKIVRAGEYILAGSHPVSSLSAAFDYALNCYNDRVSCFNGQQAILRFKCEMPK
jgi:hypothetical protein